MEHHLIKLYDDWLPVRKVFKRPKLHWYFGKWSHDPCLPVWRRGPIINLYRRGSNKVYAVKDSVSIVTEVREYTKPDGTIGTYNVSEFVNHKLPYNLRSWDVMWTRPIRKKLRKYHLGWLRPTIQLPIWLSFHIFNQSMFWKTKYDEFRFEFPPQFTIVFFGLSLSFWLKAPETELTKGIDDHYWEAIMYYESHNSLKEAIEGAGIWATDIGKNEKSYFALRPEFLQKEYLEEYNSITKKLKGKKKIL